MGMYRQPIQATTSETLPGAGYLLPGCAPGCSGVGRVPQAERAPRLQRGSRSARRTGVRPQVGRARDPKESECAERQGDGVTGTVA